MVDEQWLLIKGFPGYEVSDRGRLRSFRGPGSRWGHRGSTTAKILRSSPNSKGYLVNVLLQDDGSRHTKHLHRIVIEHFGPPQPENTECSHRDGNKANCAATNLLWETHRRNMGRQVEHGTNPAGERNPKAKLTLEQVEVIRSRRESGEVYRTIAEDFRVTISAVYQICTGENWR